MSTPLPDLIRPKNLSDFLGQDLKYGKGYKYTPLENSADQKYFPEEIKERKYL